MKFEKPLKGLKVLDLTRVVVGPFCTMQLGDMGAEIIKVESPGKGDDLRSTPPFINGESTYFFLLNRNKKSITINLKHPRGKEILWKLIEDADVFIENFRPGVIGRLGFDYENVSRANPGIIYCSISGYGQENHQGAYDPIVQGESGVTSVTGEPDGVPMKVGVPIGDLVSSLYAIQGIVYAYMMRSRTGRGQYMEISLLDSLVSLLSLPASVYLEKGENPERKGNAHPTFNPYTLFETRDGFINIAVANDTLWHKLCDAMGWENLKSDTRFATIEARFKNRHEVNAMVREEFKKKPTSVWKELLTRYEVPNGVVKTLKDIFTDETLQKRGMIGSMNHPKLGLFQYIGNPVKMSGVTIDYLPPPLLGAHNDEILTGLGYTRNDIEELKKEKAI